MKSEKHLIDNEFYTFSVIFIINYPLFLSKPYVLIRPSYAEIPYPERNISLKNKENSY